MDTTMRDRDLPSDPLNLPILLTRFNETPPDQNQPDGSDWVRLGTWKPIETQAPSLRGALPERTSGARLPGEGARDGALSIETAIASFIATDRALANPGQLLRDLNILPAGPRAPVHLAQAQVQPQSDTALADASTRRACTPPTKPERQPRSL